MQLMKKLIKFYVESNIHVGIAGASFLLISVYGLNIDNVFISPLFVFFSILLSYQFIRVFENCTCTYYSVLSFLKKQPFDIIVLIFVSLIGTVYFGSLLQLAQILVLIPAVLLTFWYAIPILNYKGKKVSLRNYPKLKLFSIALVWSIVTVLLPLHSQIFETHVWVQFTQRFILIMALVLPFDIRDIEIDIPDLKTLPQQIGVSKTIGVGVLLLVLYLVLSFLRFPLNEVIILSDLFVFIISLLFLIKASPKQSKYYTSFWVESIPIFWLIFMCGIDVILN